MKNNFKRNEQVKFWDSMANEFFFGTVVGRVRPGVDSYRIKNVKTEGGFLITKETVVDDVASRAMGRVV